MDQQAVLSTSSMSEINMMTSRHMVPKHGQSQIGRDRVNKVESSASMVNDYASI